MEEILRPVQISAKQMLEDLNSCRQPHGLRPIFQAIFHVTADAMNLEYLAEAYTYRLRECVDLWLATGRTKGGTEKPANRKPSREISDVVEDVANANFVRPVALRDGYAFRIELNPDQIPMKFTPEPQKPSPRPTSNIDGAQYSDLEEYAGALLEEQLKAIEGQQDSAPSTEVLETEEAEPAIGTLSTYDKKLANTAAEIAFVAMLVSDWRLKIAKCANPRCQMYFQLGKWNQLYPKGTFCAGCRLDRKAIENKDRMGKARRLAEQELCRLAATHFRRKVTDPSWHKDSRTKRSVVSFLNLQIGRNVQLKTAYPRGVTEKWLGWQKNWDAITAAAKQIAKA